MPIDWIPVKSYKEVPKGTWLVKTTRPNNQIVSNIQVMRNNLKVPAIGHHFAHDEYDVIAYRSLE